MSILISDICGTLVRENTTRGFLAWMAGHGGRTREIHAALSRPVSWVSVRSGVDLSRRLLIRTLRGYDRAQLETEARAYAERALAQRGRVSLLETLRRNAQAGGTLVLASATLDPVARAFGDILGAKAAVSSRLAYDAHHRCLGRLDSDLTGRKWTEVRFLIATSKPEDVILHTDNHEDLELMQHVSRTVFYGVPTPPMMREIPSNCLTTVAAESP